jgi:hypothetical protein
VRPAISSDGSYAVPISEQQRVAGILSLSVVQEKLSLFYVKIWLVIEERSSALHHYH